jgi:peptidoglycan hydrolase-like protein with peptidoglycan-binding domain
MKKGSWRYWLCATALIIGLVIAALVAWQTYKETNRTWPRIAYDLHKTLPAVKTIQYMLKDRGYDPGVADGVFGPRTLKIVQAFQQHQGLPVTGIVDNQTWEQLIHVYNEPEQCFCTMALQQQINANSSRPPLQIDGEYGPLTMTALRLYQSDHHLSPTGKIDLYTWCLLVGGHLM